jgi:hypothetical protein
MKHLSVKRKRISKSERKVRKAIELVQLAQDMIVSIMEKELENFQINTNFYAYGQYGFNQLLGEGNPNDSGLHTIIEKLQEEDL